MLTDARNQYYYLTFLHPEKLYYALDFFENPEPSEHLLNALKFINPQVEQDMLLTFETEELTISEDGKYVDIFSTLCAIGKFLHTVSKLLIALVVNFNADLRNNDTIFEVYSEASDPPHQQSSAK